MSSAQSGIVVVPPSPTPNASQASATTTAPPNPTSPSSSQNNPPDTQPQAQPTQQQQQQQANTQLQQLQQQQLLQLQLQQQHQNPPPSPTSASAPRPRDVRLVELLLTSSGVTSYEPRVPLLLLDFAYRHTSSILTDALHQSYDPYARDAGAKLAFASGGAAPPPSGDASVSANAVRLAIASRLNYQYRGGASAGGMARDFLQDLARERNTVALPKVPPSEWGLRLPSEKFVLTGGSWGLRDGWVEEGDGSDDEEEEGEDHDEEEEGEDHDEEEEGEDHDDDEDDEEMGGMDSAEGAANHPRTEQEVDGGDEVEPGTIDEVFGNDDDEEMEE